MRHAISIAPSRSCECGLYFITGRGERVQGADEILRLHEHIVRIERRNRENADLRLGEDCRNSRKDADKREIQHSHNAEAAPPVIPLCRFRRNPRRLADERVLLVRLPDKGERRIQVHRRPIRDLADRKLPIQNFDS